MTEPTVGTYARAVWDMADVLHRKSGRVPERKEVVGKLSGVSLDTIKLAYPAWRKFHGLPRKR